MALIPRIVRRAHRALPPRQRVRARRVIESLAAGAENPTVFGHVDVLFPVAGRGAFLAGWVSGIQGDHRIEVVSGSGARADIDPSWHRFQRLDVDEHDPRIASLGRQGEAHGFACLAPLSIDSPRGAGIHLDISDARGPIAILPAPAPVFDAARGRALAIEALYRGTPTDDFIIHHFHPAISAIMERLNKELEVSNMLVRGSPPSHPEVSIVVWLHEGVGSLGLQIALLSAGSDLQDVELILVFDSPGTEEEVAELSYDLHRLYAVSVRILVLNRNAGYSTANNLGARYAQGSLILFLSPDVFPDDPAWLGEAIPAYHSHSRIGALSPKLVYEDRAVQHAGLYFVRDPLTGYWQNEHFCKGLPSNTPSANVTRRVPAVSGACLLVDAELFRRVGGFDPSYIPGGEHEDSDLCLRLAAEGYESLYLSEVELFRLEQGSRPEEYLGPSGDPYPDTAPIVNYNRWLQTYRWDSEIGTLMDGLAEKPPPT